MRIISQFSDYYDSIQGLGQDQDLVYLRSRKELPFKYTFPSVGRKAVLYWARAKADINMSEFIIGFCGKIYGAVKLETTDPKKPNPYTDKKIGAFCYNLEDVDSFVAKYYSSKQRAEYYQPLTLRSHSKRTRAWPYGYSRYRCEIFFKEVAQSQDAFAHLFQEHYCPALSIEKGIKEDKDCLILNPLLKNFEFYRKFDPYTAFQEIQMFLGGMASPEKPIPEVSDTDMIICKGFDPRYSFRKEPGKKKRRKHRDKK